jgi:glycosyltransferase involved in cell wall biosynthesis
VRVISVITPVLNGAEFIERCIASVAKQACDDMEHIIIDGGSTDGTQEVLSRCAEERAGVRWLSEKDLGQSDAMNKGLATAKGEIIGILNVDDTYEPGVLHRVATLFRDQPVPSLLVANCNFLDGKGELMFVHKPRGLNLRDIVSRPTKYPFPANPSAYFYHRSLHDAIGPYKVGEHYVLDLDFLLRAVQSANVVYYDETWGNFHYHSACKTYVDRHEGRNQKRVADYLRLYRRRLPLLLRLYSGACYAVFESAFSRWAAYWLRHPEKLPAAVARRVARPGGGQR